MFPSGICPGTGASSEGCAKEGGNESLESQVFGDHGQNLQGPSEQPFFKRGQGYDLCFAK